MPRLDTKTAVYEATMYIKLYKVAVVVVHVPVYCRVSFQRQFYFADLIFVVKGQPRK